MFTFGRRNRKFKLGMCYLADTDPNSGAGGAGGGAGNDGNPSTVQKPEGGTDNGGEGNKDAKFTQEDVNKVLSDRLATEKAKHEKEIADLKAKMEREAELAKMSENERVKAELEDYKKKFQEEADKNALAVQTEETRKMLEAANIPTAFLKFVQVPKDSKQTQLNVNELKTVFDAEVKKGVEAQIKPHKPNGNTNTVAGTDNKNNSGRSYSGFNLQNSVAEYYNKN